MVSGCGSAQINRIDKNRDLYDQWPLEVRQAILDGKVEPGMTPQMVEVAWGKPTEVVNRSNAANDEEIWIYRKGGDDGTMMMPVGGPSYPGGMYPGTYPGTYPGGVYPGGTGVGISTGRGGTSIMTGTGIGLGGPGGVGMGGMGGMGTVPVMVGRPTPAEEREVVFRNGVVYRADAP